MLPTKNGLEVQVWQDCVHGELNVYAAALAGTQE